MKRLLTVVLLMAVLIVMPVSYVAGQGDYFREGVYLDGVKLSDYTYPQAFTRFSADIRKKVEGFSIRVVVEDKSGDKEYKISGEDIGYTVDTMNLLYDIWLKNGTENTGSLSSSVSADQKKIEASVDRLIGQIKQNYRLLMSEAEFRPRLINITKDLKPRTLRLTNMEVIPIQEISTVSESIESNIIDQTGEDVVSFLPLAPGQAQRMIAEAEEKAQKAAAEAAAKSAVEPKDENIPDGYELLSTYTTKTTNIPNRNTNIRLASEAINGSYIEPGETFSYWSKVGNTTVEKGYKVATILVSGKKAQGIGGGICQVSSTLYNTVLLGEQEVVMRYPHSAPVDYVPKGKDATVSWPNVDFKFKNITDKRLYIKIDYDNKDLVVSLYKET